MPRFTVEQTEDRLYTRTADVVLTVEEAAGLEGEALLALLLERVDAADDGWSDWEQDIRDESLVERVFDEHLDELYTNA